MRIALGPDIRQVHAAPDLKTFAVVRASELAIFDSSRLRRLAVLQCAEPVYRAAFSNKADQLIATHRGEIGVYSLTDLHLFS